MSRSIWVSFAFAAQLTNMSIERTSARVLLDPHTELRSI